MIVMGATVTPSRRSMLASRWTQTSSSITRRVGGVLGEGNGDDCEASRGSLFGVCVVIEVKVTVMRFVVVVVMV